MPTSELVSIVMPTYRRPDMLRRAVESVLVQTYVHWELIVTDDEQPSGLAWAYLEEIAATDPRVRIFRNPGNHGQIPNVNFAMSKARGKWIKPLYDDDVLRCDCLERFVEAAGDRDDVALVNCLTDRYAKGELVKRAKRGKRAPIECIAANHALLAMYYQDVEIGLPTQVMVARELVQDRGVMFEQPLGIHSGIDAWWYARLLQYGDLLLINESLVEEHQGEHETLTSSVSDEQFDEEIIAFRRLIHPMLDPALSPAPLPVVEQSMLLNRAIYRLYRRHPLGALRMAMKVHRLSAWRLGLRWFLRRLFPGSFHIVPRVAA